MSALIEGRIHYVYTLADRTHFRFKLGVSVNPLLRAKALPQDFHLGASTQTGFTMRNAYYLEGYIQKLYHACRVDPRLIGSVDGKTEWFCNCCMIVVERILREAPRQLVRQHCVQRELGRYRVEWARTCFCKAR